MVSKQQKNRFLAVNFFAKKIPVTFPCSGCKTTNFNYPEESCIVAPDGDIYSRYIRFDRLCDFFISEFVC